MAGSVRAGDVLASRYTMVDLLGEADGGWMWNAHDKLLHRPVSIHLLNADDPRTQPLLRAARRSATLTDRRNLRVLDCNLTDRLCYVVNEWGTGTSLDIALAANGPMSPVRAAWLVAEVADTVAVAHAAGATHGRLVPENVLIDENGEIRIIGFGVEAALHRLPSTVESDLNALAALLHATLTGKWAGQLDSQVPKAPRAGGRWLRPRQVRAGIPRPLDQICDEALNGPPLHASGASLTAGLGAVLGPREHPDLSSAATLRDTLQEFIGQHEPDLGAHSMRPSAPVAGVAPVERPWTPPPGEEPLEPLPAFGSLAGAPEPGPLPEPVVEQTTVAAREPLTDATEVRAPSPVLDAEAAEPAGSDDSGGSDGSDGATDTADIPEVTDDVPAAGAAVGPADTGTALGATEAGLPVFDGDQVEWVRTRAVPPEPAPTPAEPAARPLFAPESESASRRARLSEAAVAGQGLGGASDHAERPDTAGGTGGTGGTGGSHAPRLPDEYWPWDSTNPGAMSSSGVIPVVPGDPVPGRRWVFLGCLVGAAALLLLGGVAAWQWSSHSDRPQTPAPSSESPSPSESSGPAGEPDGPLKGLSATDLDPEGNPPEEYPEQAPLAVDGDPETFWGTQTYKEQFGPGGLKSGVGLVVDLGESKDVRQVQVSVLGGDTTAQVFITDEAPSDVANLEADGSASGTATLTTAFDNPRAGRFVTIWLTSVPNQDGGFRGKIAEIDVFA